MGCCGNQQPAQEIPNLFTRAANLTKAVFHWGLAGFPLTSDEAYQKRIDICHANTCEQLVDDAVCKHPQCGCPVTRKAAIATEACPLGLWTAETVIAQRSPPAGCRHQSYIPHVYQDRRTETHYLEITIICKECGAKMVFPEHGSTDKLRVLIKAKEQ